MTNNTREQPSAWRQTLHYLGLLLDLAFYIMCIVGGVAALFADDLDRALLWFILAITGATLDSVRGMRR